MKYNMLSFFVMLFLFSCQTKNEIPSPDFQSMIATFNAENSNWSNAAKTNDATYITNLYHEDAYMSIPNRQVIHGKKKIGEHWQKSVEFLNDLGFQTLSLNGNHEIIYERGIAFASYTLDQKVLTDTSNYVLVWKNIGNGDYKIMADIFNQYPKSDSKQ